MTVIIHMPLDIYLYCNAAQEPEIWIAILSLSAILSNFLLPFPSSQEAHICFYPIALSLWFSAPPPSSLQIPG